MIEHSLRKLVEYSKQFYNITDKHTLSILIDVYTLGYKDSLTGKVRDAVWKELEMEKNEMKEELE